MEKNILVIDDRGSGNIFPVYAALCAVLELFFCEWAGGRRQAQQATCCCQNGSALIDHGSLAPQMIATVCGISIAISALSSWVHATGKPLQRNTGVPVSKPLPGYWGCNLKEREIGGAIGRGERPGSE